VPTFAAAQDGYVLGVVSHASACVVGHARSGVM
jgi:hypothetical protein